MGYRYMGVITHLLTIYLTSRDIEVMSSFRCIDPKVATHLRALWYRRAILARRGQDQREEMVWATYMVVWVVFSGADWSPKWCFVLPDTLGFKVILFTVNRGSTSLLKHHLRENISWELFASIKEANPSM